MKRQIFRILQPDHGLSYLSRLFDSFITALILLSVVAVFASTFDLSLKARNCLIEFEKWSSIIFTIEYLLRIWTADCLYPGRSGLGARVKYVTSGMAIVDLFAILPFWLPMILPGSLLGVRALRLVRLLRILKLNRYFDAISSIATVIHDKRRELIGSTFFVCLLMLVSSLLVYTAEHDAQPDALRNAFSGLWWAVATLTTVGYGDIYPVTVVGRLLGTFIALLGVAAVAIPTGIISSGLIEQMSKKSGSQLVCPHCGNKIERSE